MATTTGSRQDIRLVKVKGTQHPPDAGTKFLSKQGMLHAKSMLGLVEPEILAPYGYEVEEASGFKDRLAVAQQISTVATVRVLRLLSDREIGGLATSFIFMLEAGHAPVRAGASQEMEIVTLMDHRQQSDGDVVWRMVLSTLLITTSY
eukprot:5672954-Amphidinium_carterae.1